MNFIASIQFLYHQILSYKSNAGEVMVVGGLFGDTVKAEPQDRFELAPIIQHTIKILVEPNDIMSPVPGELTIDTVEILQVQTSEARTWVNSEPSFGRNNASSPGGLPLTVSVAGKSATRFVLFLAGFT